MKLIPIIGKNVSCDNTYIQFEDSNFICKEIVQFAANFNKINTGCREEYVWQRKFQQFVARNAKFPLQNKG